MAGDQHIGTDLNPNPVIKPGRARKIAQQALHAGDRKRRRRGIIEVRLPAELLATLKELATAEDRTLEDQIKHCVRLGLWRADKEQG